MLRKILFSVLFVGVLLGVGCKKEIGPTPQDFSFRYHWVGGTVPPPNHYEYVLEMSSDGKVKVTYYFGYGEDKDTQVLTKELPVVNEGERKLLYQQLVDTKLFKNKELKGRQGNETVGGGYSWLDIQSNGKTYKIGSNVVETAEIKYFYERIQQLIPGSVYQEVEKQRQEYIKNYQSR